MLSAAHCTPSVCRCGGCGSIGRGDREAAMARISARVANSLQGTKITPTKFVEHRIREVTA